MLDVTGLGFTDRPLLALGVTVAAASVVFVGIQLAVGGGVSAVATVTFAVVFGVLMLAFAWLRDRYLE